MHTFLEYALARILGIPLLATLLAGTLGCGGAGTPRSDAGTTAHVCSPDLEANSACDFAGSCARYDHSGGLCGVVVASCVDGWVVIDDGRFDCFYECTPDFTVAPTVTMRITHVTLPGPAGFRVDAFNDDLAHGGGSVEGCGPEDATGGVDDALSPFAAAVAGSVDVASGLARSLAQTAADAGIGASLEVSVALFGLDAANDTCVGVRLHVASASASEQVVDLVGNSNGGTVHAWFAPASQGHLVLPVTLTPAASSCGSTPCGAGTLELPLSGLAASLTLDAQLTRIEAGSELGGFVFLEDCAGGVVDPTTGDCLGGAFATANATGFAHALRAWGSEVQWMPSTTAALLDQAVAVRDIHVEPSGYVTRCTSPTNSVTDTNANSMSFSLGVDSLGP